MSSATTQITGFDAFWQDGFEIKGDSYKDRVHHIWESLTELQSDIQADLTASVLTGYFIGTIVIPDSATSEAATFFKRLQNERRAIYTLSYYLRHVSTEKFSEQFNSFLKNPDLFFTAAKTAAQLSSGYAPYHRHRYMAFRLSLLGFKDAPAIHELMKYYLMSKDPDSESVPSLIFDTAVLGDTPSLTDMLFIARNDHADDLQKAFDRANGDAVAIRKILPDLYLSHNDPAGLERAVEILLLQDTRDSKEQARTLQLFLDLIKLKVATPQQIAAYKTAYCYQSFQEDLVQADTPDKMRQIEARLQAAIEAGTTYQVLKARENLAELFADQGDVGSRPKE